MQIKQTNISIFLPIFGLTVSFGDPLWFAMYHDHDDKHDDTDKLGLLWLNKNLKSAEESGAFTFTLKINLKC